MMMGKKGGNYLVYGNPTIVGNIMTPSLAGYIYTDKPFNPAASSSWIIQIKTKMLSFKQYCDILSSVLPDGTKSGNSITVQTDTLYTRNKVLGICLSNAETSWNITTSHTLAANSINIDNKYNIFQVVCEKTATGYRYRAGWPELESWTAWVNSSIHPTYGNHLSFGGGYALSKFFDGEFDLSETKIFIDGQIWWSAL